jgi:hypothetical protein
VDLSAKKSKRRKKGVTADDARRESHGGSDDATSGNSKTMKTLQVDYLSTYSERYTRINKKSRNTSGDTVMRANKNKRREKTRRVGVVHLPLAERALLIFLFYGPLQPTKTEKKKLKKQRYQQEEGLFLIMEQSSRPCVTQQTSTLAIAV